MPEKDTKTPIDVKDIKKEVLDSNLSDDAKIYIIENLKEVEEYHHSPYYVKKLEKPERLDGFFFSPPMTCKGKGK